MSEKIECLVCGHICGYQYLGTHVNRKHFLDLKEYYDKFLKKDKEGNCLICHKITKYWGRTYSSKNEFGFWYNLTCGRKCGHLYRNSKNMEKYGVENNFQIPIMKEKSRRTNMLKYGVENSGESSISMTKRKITCLEKYGTEHPIHNIEVAKKCRQGWRTIPKKYITKFGNEILLQSSYELYFIRKCENDNIEIKNGPYINYEFNGKQRKYFIDFELTYADKTAKLVEIKSTFTYKKDKEQIEIKKKYAEKYALDNGLVYELNILELFGKDKIEAKKEYDNL